MAILYVPRSNADTKVEGYALTIPAAGLTLGYEVAALEKFCQDVLGSSSPLIKTYTETVAAGAPTGTDTFVEVANELSTKLTATKAATVAAFGVTTDLALASPVAASLSASYVDSEVISAFAAKADQAAVSSMMATAEARMDDLEGKFNAMLTALKNAGIMNV